MAILIEDSKESIRKRLSEKDWDEIEATKAKNLHDELKEEQKNIINEDMLKETKFTNDQKERALLLAGVFWLLHMFDIFTDFWSFIKSTAPS